MQTLIEIAPINSIWAGHGLPCALFGMDHRRSCTALYRKRLVILQLSLYPLSCCNRSGGT